MTNDELYSILRRYLLTDGVAQHALSLIWGQPFDGETERIKPATEDSSAVLSESFRDGTTYTRSYQVFLPTPKPTQPNPNHNMYDEITNSDLICQLIENAHPIGKPNPQWELMVAAARRIEKLDVQAKKWERLAKEWESAADAASNCGTPDNLRALLNSL